MSAWIDEILSSDFNAALAVLFSSEHYPAMYEIPMKLEFFIFKLTYGQETYFYGPCIILEFYKKRLQIVLIAPKWIKIGCYSPSLEKYISLLLLFSENLHRSSLTRPYDEHRLQVVA